MRFFRRNKFGLNWLASFAMAISVFAAAALPQQAMAAGGTQIFDAVLGWIPVCAPSKSADSKSSSKHETAQHACCALACAAAAAAAVAPLQSFSFAEFYSHVPGEFSELPQVERPSRRAQGSLGSRGPPLVS